MSSPLWWRGGPRESDTSSRTGDTVRGEPPPHLISAERHSRSSREPAVDRAGAEPVAPEPELEHRDVPSDRTDTELALTEQRAAARPERAPRRAADEPRRANPVLALKGEQRVRRQLAANAVDRTGVEPVSPKPDLEGGDASTGCERARSERENTNGHRDADDGEATHAAGFGDRARRSSRGDDGEARLQSRGCLPR